MRTWASLGPLDVLRPHPHDPWVEPLIARLDSYEVARPLERQTVNPLDTTGPDQANVNRDGHRDVAVLTWRDRQHVARGLDAVKGGAGAVHPTILARLCDAAGKLRVGPPEEGGPPLRGSDVTLGRGNPERCQR